MTDGAAKNKKRRGYTVLVYNKEYMETRKTSRAEQLAVFDDLERLVSDTQAAAEAAQVKGEPVVEHVMLPLQYASELLAAARSVVGPLDDIRVGISHKEAREFCEEHPDYEGRLAYFNGRPKKLEIEISRQVRLRFGGGGKKGGGS